MLYCIFVVTYLAEGRECHVIRSERDLTNALTDISEWKKLGYELRVRNYKLESIDEDEKGTDSKLRATLNAWYNQQDHNPCWQSITVALRRMDQNRLASLIEQCTECINRGTDCDLTVCIKNGVDTCGCSEYITPEGFSIGLMGTQQFILLLCLYFISKRSEQGKILLIT